MTDKISFDPTKKFGIVCGVSTLFPGAKYQQGPYVFDTHRRCLNPDVAAVGTTEVQQATNDLTRRLSLLADKALAKLQDAAKHNEIEQSPQSKSAHTKAYNVYTQAQAKLDKLTEG